MAPTVLGTQALELSGGEYAIHPDGTQRRGEPRHIPLRGLQHEGGGGG